MKCPHCEKKFDQICGKLFCPDHGWHELDQDGGIIPAEKPSESELKAAAKPVEVSEPQPAGVIEDDQKIEIPIGLSHSDTSYYVLVGAAGIVAILILAYTFIKQRRHAKAQQA